MLEVQHLVIHDVFHRVVRDGEAVKHEADNDGVVRGIVMAKNAAGASAAPAHAWTRQQSVEESRIQFFEDRIQIIEMPARGMQLLAPPYLPDQVRLADDFMTGEIFSIARRLAAIDGAAVHLG